MQVLLERSDCQSMKIMIDTNILLDVLIYRNEFYNKLKAVLSKCEDRTVQGFVSSSE